MRRWTVLEKVLGVATALISLVAAILGLQKEQVQQFADSRTGEVASLEAEIDTVKARNRDLEAEVLQLQAGSNLPGPTADPSPAAIASERHRGEVVLVESGGRGADLDSPSSDPQWSSGEDDVYFDGKSVSSTYYSKGLYLRDAQSDYDTCRNRNAYGNLNLELGDLTVGEYLCIETSEARYSAVRIIQLSPETATLNVVTYSPKG